MLPIDIRIHIFGYYFTFWRTIENTYYEGKPQTNAKFYAIIKNYMVKSMRTALDIEVFKFSNTFHKNNKIISSHTPFSNVTVSYF